MRAAVDAIGIGTIDTIGTVGTVGTVGLTDMAVADHVVAVKLTVRRHVCCCVEESMSLCLYVSL